jgi:D-arabinose 1-dehydrogenase-like Zn-dependent alcohol dehydrogenase
MANRFVQVSKANGPFEIVERDIPEPGPGQVRIKVRACGICHSDSLVKEGMFPGIQYPRVPGHEVAGIIDKIGSSYGETKWTPGQRVGVGWHGGYCGQCEHCRHGDFFACRKAGVTGITYDGGYADYMIAPVEALAILPDELSFTEAAPLMCAGITTYNALRNSGARVGDVVAVLGVGGVGHLGIQFATKMGFKTIAIARGKDKEELAKKLGAKHYIDSHSQNPAEEIVKIGKEDGGAKVILATVTNANAMTSVIGGLGANGKLIIIGAPNEPLEVPIFPLLTGRQSIMGWYSGTSIDSQDTLSFSVLSGVRSLNQTYPLERVSEAYDLMIKGKARFRAVLNM